MSDPKKTTEDAPAINLGDAFGVIMGGLPKDVAARLATYNTKVYRIDGPRGTKAAKDTTAPAALAAFDLAIDAEPDDTPEPDEMPTPTESFQEAAAVPAVETATSTSADLPDLTNAYLDKLIGWNRQRTGQNPRANTQTVWIKDRHDMWQASETETWPSISKAILLRERNLETDAANLFDHIRDMRIDMTPAILNQLLDWYREKTGKDHRKNETVWIKDSRGEWDIAPFRWNEVDREFRDAEVCARMGTKDLAAYKQKRRTAAIDLLVSSQGQLPGAQP